MIVQLTKTFRFEASHVLPKHPGKCSRLHGHSWVLHITVSGEVNSETGFVVDYAELKKLVDQEVVEKLDHYHLGCGHLEGFSRLKEAVYYPAVLGSDFYPSSENLVSAIARILAPLVAEFPRFDEVPVLLEAVELEETCTARATWRRSDNVI